MSRIPNLASERGAVLIQTVLSALVLVGFGTFVIDYGVLWVGRHQAQNAADAGAIAGAIARAYDDFDDPPGPGGAVDQNVSEVVGTNLVWSTSPTVFPLFSSTACPPEVGASGRCVRVDVYRNAEHGTPLPTWFARLFGITSQGVKATATAQAVIPNATNCLRPWAIPDKWVEKSNAPPDPSFRKYAAGGALLLDADFYQPPDSFGSGTGLTFPAGPNGNSVPADLGLSVALTFNDLRNPINPILPGSLVPLELPSGYAASVAACNGQPIGVEDQFAISATDPTADLLGLGGQDSSAIWNIATRTIDDSCAPVCASVSPRLAAVAVFDVELFQYRRAISDWNACLPGRPACKPCPPGTPCVSIVNVVGLFADSTGSSGRLTSYPGLIPIPPETAKLTARSSFLKAITLVR